MTSLGNGADVFLSMDCGMVQGVPMSYQLREEGPANPVFCRWLERHKERLGWQERRLLKPSKR